MDMPRRFPDVLYDHNVARLTEGHVAREAAARLPLSPIRESGRGITESHNAEWVARSWSAGIADAARDLSNLIAIHDNGGSGSSTKKIKNAAHELLRLLGED